MWLLSFPFAMCPPFLMPPLTMLSVLSSCALHKGAWLLGCIDHEASTFTMVHSRLVCVCVCVRGHTHTRLYAGAHVYIFM